MSSQKKKTPAEELMDSLLSEVEGSDENQNAEGFALDSDESAGELKEASAEEAESDDGQLEGIVQLDSPTVVGGMNFEGFLRDNRGGATLDKTKIHNPAAAAKTEIQTQMHVQNNAPTEVALSSFKGSTEINPEMNTSAQSEFSSEEASAYEATRVGVSPKLEDENQHTEFGELELEPLDANVVDLNELAQQVQENPIIDEPLSAFVHPTQLGGETKAVSLFDSPPAIPALEENARTQVISSSSNDSADSQIATVAIHAPAFDPEPAPGPVFEDVKPRLRPQVNDNEGTVAVTGFQLKPDDNLEGKVKISVGKAGRSSGFSSWGGGVDSHLGQAENLRMAQEKILELENENERLRRQNEELIAASEILKERSDLMTAQLTEYKNDREGLEQSFKNEMTLVKNHLVRRDGELKKAQIKIEELEARLKFDLKKIRVRERELENRLELVRAEKNAVSKNKDEQILDLRRKMDVMQMEVDSYRQKCVELNKQIENSQDSMKRTNRALRLAMANLELQEENKGQLKKAE